MNIAETKGDKSVKALATRLLATPAKGSVKATQAEMEASLLRLNPQLENIGELPEGTPIVVPDDFGLAPDQSTTPLRGLTEGLLAQNEAALTSLRGLFADGAEEATARTKRVEAWLGSKDAGEAVRVTPDLKEVFASAKGALGTASTEQATALAARTKALDELQEVLTAFRVQAAAPATR